MPIDSSIHLPLLPLPSKPSNRHILKRNPANEHLTQCLERRNKNAKRTRNDKHTNTLANIQPRAIIPDLPKEPERQIIANPHDDSKQRSTPEFQAASQDTQVGGDEGKGGEDFEQEESALAEGVEDGEEAEDGVEGEGGDGGDVACAEEGGLQEVEEEEGDAGVGEGEGAVGFALRGCFSGRGEGGGEFGLWC